MNSLMKNEISQWRDNPKDDFLGGLVSAFSVIPEVVGFTIIAGVNPMLGLYTSVAFLILSAFLGGRPAMVSAGAGSMALVVVALIAEYGTEYLFAAVFLAGIFQLIMGLCKVGRLIKYIPQCVMTGFVDSLAIIIFMSQIKNALGGGLTMYALVAAGIVIVYLFPRITKAVPSTLIAIIVVTAASVFLGLTTTSIGDMGNMTAALPDVHLPTLLLSLETWKIVLPYSISLAFVGLIETLLTQQVVDQMTETTSDTNRESCSQGITNMVCGCIGGMPGCAMIGQAIVNVKSGGRGRLSTLVAGVMLIAVLGFGSGLLNIIPLAALIGVMITVSIATFDWDSLRSLKDQSPLEILTTLLTVVIVVATNNLAYGVAAGLALYYSGGFAAKAFVRAS